MKQTENDHSVKSERLTITLGDDQRRQVAAIARKRRTSAATVIRWALDEYLAANATNQPSTRRTERPKHG